MFRKVLVRAPFLLMAACLGLQPALSSRAATNGAGLSLDAAATLAARNAPRVRAQRLLAQAAHDDAVRAGRLPDPKLVVGINNLTATGPRAFNAAADFMTMRMIGVMQAIPAPAKRDAARAVAGAEAGLADANAVAMRLATMRAAATAWVALWAAQRQRDLLNDLRQQARLAVTLAKAKLKGGAGSATDVLAARAAVVKLGNRVDAADADVAAAGASLQRWTGIDGTHPLGTPPDFARLRIAPARLLTEVDRQGPMLGWSARQDRAQAKLELAKAGKHPDWSVGLSYGQRIDRSDMISVQVGVSLPLFAGNRQDRDISARYAERDAVRAEHQAARRAQRVAVKTVVAQWQGDDHQVHRYRDQLLPLAADRSRTALAAYRAGGPLQPWLAARRDEIDTRIAYAQALAARGKAWARLAFLIPDHNAAAAHADAVRLP